MSKMEWLIVGLLISMGLICLTASASTMGGNGSMEGLLKTFLQICLWMGLPVLVIGIIYVVARINKKKKSGQ